MTTQETYRDLCEHSGAALALVALDGDLTYATPALAAIFGRPVEDVVGHPLSEFAPTLSARLQASDEVTPFEKSYRHPDGGERRLLVSGRLVRHGGEPVYWACQFDDVTARVQAEREVAKGSAQQAAVARLGRLALEAELLAAVYEEAVQIVVDHLPADRAVVIAARPSEREGVVRARAGLALDGDELHQVPMTDHLRFALESEEAVLSSDLRTESRFTPEPRLLDAGFVSSVTARLVAGGEPRGIIAAVGKEPRGESDGDRTFLEMLAGIVSASIARMQLDDLERHVIDQQRQAAIGTAAAEVAHALGNSLAVVRSTAELLLPGVGPNEQHQLSTMIDEVQRMGDLVQQILASAPLPGSGPERIEVADRIRASERILARLLPDGVELVLNAEAPCLVLADPMRFDQAILNLVRNAAEATTEGRVTVGCSLVGEQIDVSVSDTGSGMDAHVATRAMDAFFTTRKDVGGSGLGLAQVRQFASDCGGSVRIDTAVGPGTTVHMVIPAAAGAPRG